MIFSELNCLKLMWHEKGQDRSPCTTGKKTHLASLRRRVELQLGHILNDGSANLTKPANHPNLPEAAPLGSGLRQTADQTFQSSGTSKTKLS
jgi:hypothetical protein